HLLKMTGTLSDSGVLPPTPEIHAIPIAVGMQVSPVAPASKAAPNVMATPEADPGVRAIPQAAPQVTHSEQPAPPTETPSAPTVAEILRAAESAHPSRILPAPETPAPREPEPKPFVLMPPLKSRKPSDKDGRSDPTTSSADQASATDSGQRAKQGREVFLASLKNLHTNR
ncbi:MAG: hypothetical protein HQL86_09010, partial [Magnetococcales bacterium]|nr:hypothetical protein [Magnetococcales bacterium]